MRLKIIDFTGVPGSGKSALSKEVYEMFSDQYKCIHFDHVKRVNKEERAAKAFKYFKFIYLSLKNPETMYKFLSFYRTIKPVNLENFRYMKSSIKHFLFLRMVSKTYKDYDYLILDEGVFHKVWSMSLHGTISSQKGLKNLIEFLSKNLNTINIHSHIEKELAAERIINRDTFESRLDKLDYNTIRELLTLNEYNKKMINKIISTNRNVKTINLNGKETVRRKLEQIMDEVTT